MPAREDLATPASWASPISTRAAIEAMPEGCVAVVDAMGVTDAGIFGDILCARMASAGSPAWSPTAWCATLAGVLGTGLPVWCHGVAAPPSVAGLTFVGWQEPIGCGGVAVFPDDVVVADDDGAVLIPAGAARRGAGRGARAGADGGLDHGPRSIAACRCPGLYPMNDETKARYAAWKAERMTLRHRHQRASIPSPRRRFHPDGRLDTASIDRLTDFYHEAGATGVTILGIMGEAPKLEPEESPRHRAAGGRPGARAGGGRGVGAGLCRDAPPRAGGDGRRARRA